MRVAALTTDLEFRIEERPRPSPATDEVLVRIDAVGICGSDVHYWRHGRIGEFVVEDDVVLGHESAGEVVDAGDGVTGLGAGDRVTLEPGVPCRRCSHCARGEYNRCESVRFMATPPHDGALTEYVAWPADFAYRLPDGVSTVAGALCEPLSVGIHAARRGDVGAGDSVVVTGAGPIGQCATAAARVAGATDLTVTDPNPGKLDRACERGATRTLRTDGTDVPETVASAAGGGADVAIEASGTPDGIRDAIGSVRRGGTVVLVGMPGETEVEVNPLALVGDELDVKGSFRYRNTYPAAVSLLREGRVDLDPMVDFSAPLADVADAFERATGSGVVKGVVQP